MYLFSWTLVPGRARWLPALLALLLLLLLGCSRRQEPEVRPSGTGQPEQLELRYQGFVGQVTFPELAEDLGLLSPVKLEYIGNTISGPQDIQTVVTGDTDFGGAFNGAVLKLLAARAPIKSVIGYYGTDDSTWMGYYVLEGSPIKSARDLIGKKVAVNTVGAHAEFVLREYLARNGLSKQESEQVTLLVVPPVSAEQALRQGQAEVAVLGSILRDKALARGGIRKLFSDFDLFGKFTAGSYVFSQSFLRDHPNTVRKFVSATAQAIEWARTHPREEVIARYTAIIQRRARNENTDAISYWRSTGIAATGGVIRDSEFSVWLEWLIKSGQVAKDQVHLEEIYTNAFNPFQHSPT
jgi:ABC-type nitrate/sulfonate/bicarbonate transport system substrate-binding protein